MKTKVLACRGFVLNVLLMVLGLADWVLTELAIRTGRVVEGNPLVGHVAGTPQSAPVKVGFHLVWFLVLALGLEKFKGSVLRAFVWGLAIAVLIYLVVVVRNAYLLVLVLNLGV